MLTQHVCVCALARVCVCVCDLKNVETANLQLETQVS